MASKYTSRRKRPTRRGYWLAALASFIAGGALTGYIVYYNYGENADGASPGNGVDRQAASIAEADADPSGDATPTPRPLAETLAEIENRGRDEAADAAEAVSRVAEQQGGLDQRLAAAEQRLARLDLQAQAAAGNAARAEGLLIAFATRRAIERGADLGYLADQLRLRFADEWPNAVSTVIGFARDPVRIDNLAARLNGLAPELVEREEGMSFDLVRRELGDLFVIRRENTPSPQPERRLERARIALEQGRYQNAIDEIRALPGARHAQAWIEDAKRYRDAMEALEVIETAAVLDQRGVRDGAGNVVGQPLPIEQ